MTRTRVAILLGLASVTLAVAATFPHYIPALRSLRIFHADGWGVGIIVGRISGGYLERTTACTLCQNHYHLPRGPSCRNAFRGGCLPEYDNNHSLAQRHHFLVLGKRRLSQGHQYYLGISTWILAALLSIIPFRAAWMAWHRRIPPGLCQGCEYDLTGNESGVCPECGTNVRKKLP